jgi:hypothetical protein
MSLESNIVNRNHHFWRKYFKNRNIDPSSDVEDRKKSKEKADRKRKSDQLDDNDGDVSPKKSSRTEMPPAGNKGSVPRREKFG